MIAGKLGGKILAVMLILTAIPFIAVSYVSLMDIRSIEENVRVHESEMSLLLANDTRMVVEGLGKDIIRQKAEDVAKQAEIYIRSHPNMTVLDLQNDTYFQNIAVQPVGKTGYTALTDYSTLINRFHKSPTTVNMDLSTLAQKLPGFWSIMNRTRGGFVADGFYDWKEPDGSIRAKYMYIALINATTADGVRMSVAATTYIDEFSSPSAEIVKKINLYVDETLQQNEKLISKIRQDMATILFIYLFLIVITAIVFVRSIIGPINRLKETTMEISRGNLDARINVKSRDEIGELAQSFEQMAKELKKSQREIARHSEVLEKNVEDRTKELQSKIEELQKFNRLAVGRELKMIELKKRIQELEGDKRKKVSADTLQPTSPSGKKGAGRTKEIRRS